jgi:hypothetical protein
LPADSQAIWRQFLLETEAFLACTRQAEREGSAANTDDVAESVGEVLSNVVDAIASDGGFAQVTLPDLTPDPWCRTYVPGLGPC